jgi:hypothetical protein
MGIGPELVGLMSDALSPLAGAGGLRYAMLLMSFVAFWSAYHLWIVGRSVKDDLEMVQRLVASPTARSS